MGGVACTAVVSFQVQVIGRGVLSLVDGKASYRSMGTTGDPVPSGHRAGPDHYFTG
jgi:hypothetical protein